VPELLKFETVWDFLARPSAVEPDATCIAFEGAHYSYKEMVERSEEIARSLVSMGIKSGDRIAYIDVFTPSGVAVVFGVIRAGATVVPINYRLRSDEVEYILNNSEAKVLFLGSRYLSIVEECHKNLEHLTQTVVLDDGGDKLPDFAESFKDFKARSDSSQALPESTIEGEAVILYTSGTTGRPKGAILSQATFMQRTVSPERQKLVATFAAMTGKPQITVLVMPLYHIGGIGLLFVTTAYGNTVAGLRQFDAKEFMNVVEHEKASYASLVPTMLKQVLDHPEFSKDRFKSLKAISYGAAPMPVELIRRAVATLPIMYTNFYGQTEMGSAMTSLGPQDHFIVGTPEQKELKLKRLASVGKPLEGVEVRIVDEEGAVLPANMTGEIQLLTDRPMDGYIGIKEGDAAHPIEENGWYSSGDMGYIDEDGYIFIAGRNKDMIIRGGENISPEEIEQVIHSYPGVAEAAIVGVPDEEWGECIQAVVVMEPGKSADAADIQSHVAEHLASYKKPDFVAFIGELPRNHVGKVLKNTLRDEYGAT